MTLWELIEAIEIGMECDPTPITVYDLAEILRDSGTPEVSTADVMKACKVLLQKGVLEKDVMFDKERNGTVDHYYHIEWDGKR